MIFFNREMLADEKDPAWNKLDNYQLTPAKLKEIVPEYSAQDSESVL